MAVPWAAWGGDYEGSKEVLNGIVWSCKSGRFIIKFPPIANTDDLLNISWAQLLAEEPYGRSTQPRYMRLHAVGGPFNFDLTLFPPHDTVWDARQAQWVDVCGKPAARAEPVSKRAAEIMERINEVWVRYNLLRQCPFGEKVCEWSTSITNLRSLDGRLSTADRVSAPPSDCRNGDARVHSQCKEALVELAQGRWDGQRAARFAEQLREREATAAAQRRALARGQISKAANTGGAQKRKSPFAGPTQRTKTKSCDSQCQDCA